MTDELINMTWAWDKEISESLTGIKPVTSRTHGGHSIHWATRTHEQQRHLTEFISDDHDARWKIAEKYTVDIKDITWWWVMFEWQEQYLTQVSAANKWDIVIQAKYVIFFLLYRQKTTQTQTVVKKWEMTSLISSLVMIWKICHSGPGCSFEWILRVVYFPVKHLCLYKEF